MRLSSSLPQGPTPASGPGDLGSGISDAAVGEWRRQGLPRSWGTPIVLLPCSSTPAGPNAPGHSSTPAWPPLCPQRRLPHCSFRGSITRLRHSLSTLRSAGYPNTTQDSLPAAGQALPDRLDYLKGPIERFQRMLSTSSHPPSPSFVAQGHSTFSLSFLVVLAGGGRIRGPAGWRCVFARRSCHRGCRD